jgi:hypothetical protein
MVMDGHHLCKTTANQPTKQPSNQVWAQAGQLGRIYSSNSIIILNPPTRAAPVKWHPPARHPLDVRYHSAVDEPQLS